jgi:glycosyltransferase involved in cell wall biosynthesis
MGRVSLILAISDFCRDEYRRRYPTIRSLVLYNPVPHAAPPDPNSVAVSPRGAVARLVFAGSVYGANAHALLCVNQALNVSKGTRACLEIYTAQAESTVRDFGFGKNVHIMKSRPQTEIARAISGADIALLPMGIESPFPEVIRTSSPMKLADYCVSLRPILACVPEDSFAAWYLKKHDAAWVESTGRPESIAATIQAILSDADGRRRKVANALACARRDFSAEVLQRRLVESINKVLEDHAA